MKQSLTFILLFVCAVASAQTIERFSINPAKSKVTWSGKKIVGKPMEGTITIEKGNLEFNKKNLVAGEVLMNTRSIASETASARLVAHLKNDDFFSVDIFPVASFVITSVRGNIMKGKMTIKGITHEMSIPVDVTYGKDVVLAKALQIKVDRTKYDVKYRSGNIFSELGDSAIEDDFILNIELTAEKK